MPRKDWLFIKGIKSHTQDGSELVRLMKNVGSGKKTIRAIDVGCGDGIIAWDLIQEKKATSVLAIDLWKAATDAAAKNLAGLPHVEVLKICAKKIFKNRKYFDTFDRFVINPPFFTKGSGQENKTKLDQSARHEGSLSLKDWSKGARNLLKTGGELYFVFPTERLIEASVALSKNGVEPKELWWMKQDLRQRRFFMRAVRGAKPGLIVHI